MVGAVSNLLLKHPGIWRGEELWRRDDCEVWFTDDEVTQLEEAITASDGQPVDALGKEDLLLGELAVRLAAVQQQLEEGRGICVGAWIAGGPVFGRSTTADILGRGGSPRHAGFAECGGRSNFQRG